MSIKSYKRIIWLYLLVYFASVWCPTRLDAGIIHQQDFEASDFGIYSITAPNGDSFSKVSGRDMFGGGEVGQPELPYKVIRFLVPDNAYDFNVTIEDMSTASPFVLENAIYPVQKDIPINDYRNDMFTYPDMEKYRSLKTSFRAEILEESRLEGRYHIVSVGLWPLAYSGNEKELDMCTSMLIDLDYKENALFKQKSSSANTTSFINISDIVVNAKTSPQKVIIGDTEEGTSTNGKLPRYYIISERNLLAACEDLTTWKAQKGYIVIKKAIEDIYNDPKYKVGSNSIVDEAASLRKYLQDEYATYGTFFCFLVGDHRTRMPIRKAYITNESTNTAFNGDHYIPTDNYFANLAEDKWKVVRSNIGTYCDRNTLDYDPYIYIGRLLCHSIEEINNYTSKLILYESNPGRGNSGYLNKSLITMQYDALDYKTSTFSVVSEMTEVFKSVESLRDTVYSNSSLTHCFPTGEIMLKRMNQNGYCSLNGHGEPTTIACSGKNHEYATWEYIKALESYRGYSLESNIPYQCNNCGLDLMTNCDYPSVVYTMACTTAPFDIYDTFDVPHTMASSFTCGGKYGGVAYLANTRSGYWPSSNYLERQFLKVIKNNTIIGIAESMSKVNYTTSNYVRAAHNLIGDPEFRLWLKSPSELDVSACWEDDLLISGFDSDGCTVVQNDGEGNVRKKTTTVLPTTPIGYLSSGKMRALGIFKDGFLPQVRIDCSNDNLTDCNKKFIVRTAEIGLSEEKLVFIGSNANINIKAVDYISTGQGLSIEKNGELTLRCDKNIELAGTEVNSGGVLHLTAQKVVLSDGFSVKAGGTLSIRGN